LRGSVAPRTRFDATSNWMLRKLGLLTAMSIMLMNAPARASAR
jgi:hypothetical protein